MPAAVALAEINPKIGYLYPAGGQKGTVIRIIAGGQKLNNANGVNISGKGVNGKIIGNYRLRKNLKSRTKNFTAKNVGRSSG